jgi:lipoprotein NlpD
VAKPAVAESKPEIKPEPKPEPKPVASASPVAVPKETPDPKSDAKVDARDTAVARASNDDDHLDWVWPAKGDLVYRFGESGKLKGVGIGGKNGQPVFAAAPGKVVYSGSGLRGYGKLVIIKHNDMFLSVYAHNSKILVKEGETVKRGQRIADMGDTDASRVALHFEIRRFGKPVDPVTQLPGDHPS